MSNVNVIAQYVSGTGQVALAPLALGASTTETLVSLNANAFAPTLGGGVAVLRGAVEGAVPSFYAGGQRIRVSARGTITTGVSTNITATLYNASAAQIA